MTSASQLVEHYFRHEYGRLVALLTSRLGASHLQLAEDVVQSALSRALATWPRSGTPDDPSAWLYRIARNLAIDALRRQAVDQRVTAHRASLALETASSPTDALDCEIGDETLRLLFLCCHPALPLESRVALSLKTVGGFGIREIASGLLTASVSIEKRITRAKERLREQAVELTELRTADVADRLDAVLSTIYLIFNEGYSATAGEQHVRIDLCQEGIRLARMLLAHPASSRPAVFALLSLMLFHTARLDSRLDAQGFPILLADQNRTQWNWEMIREAMDWMRQSASGDELSRYHIESAIAWEHCRSADFATTNWPRIAGLYEILIGRFATPMTLLNAAVARSYAESAQAGRTHLLAIDGADRKRLHPWWDCCMAQMFERSGDTTAALRHWRDALALANSPNHRQFVQQQINRLAPGGG